MHFVYILNDQQAAYLAMVPLATVVITAVIAGVCIAWEKVNKMWRNHNRNRKNADERY